MSEEIKKREIKIGDLLSSGEKAVIYEKMFDYKKEHYASLLKTIDLFPNYKAKLSTKFCIFNHDFQS